MISFYLMTINMFTCFREIQGMTLIFVYFLVFKGSLYWGGYIRKDIYFSEWRFYIRDRLYGGAHIFGILQYVTFSGYYNTPHPNSHFKIFSPVSTEAQQLSNQVMFPSLTSTETMCQAFLANQIVQILSDCAYSCNIYTTIACKL